jgi:hypothetical protein
MEQNSAYNNYIQNDGNLLHIHVTPGKEKKVSILKISIFTCFNKTFLQRHTYEDDAILWITGFDICSYTQFFLTFSVIIESTLKFETTLHCMLEIYHSNIVGSA